MTRFLSCSQFGWQKVEKLNQTVAILNVWLRSGSHLNRKRDKTQPDTTKFFLSHYLKSQKKICLALALFGFGPFERFMARVRPNFGSVRLGIFVRAVNAALNDTIPPNSSLYRPIRHYTTPYQSIQAYLN